MSDTPNGTTNVLVVGIGGQGVMTATEALARAAMTQGLDVKKTEVAGMAQRGGVVTSHVRFGPRILSPAIPEGEADLLLGFEPAEAMRWCRSLRPDGLARVNTMRLVPPIVSSGLFAYPDDPIAAMREAGVRVVAFDAGAIARRLGDARLVNSIMLGTIADHLPFPPELLKGVIAERFRAKKPALAELNERAFDAGREAAEQAAAA